MKVFSILCLLLGSCFFCHCEDMDSESGSGETEVTLDPERECQPIDLAFVMDSSGSINDDNPDNFNKMKTFLIDIVQMLPRMIGTGRMDNRIAAVTYSALTYMEFTFNDGTDLYNVEQLIDSIKYRGSETNMAGGLELALNNLFESSAGDRPDSADVIVLITDGQGNRREDEELPFAEAAKSRNISIITVGITHKVNRDRLTEMATDGAFVMIDNFDVLQTMTQTILDFACKPLEIETTTVEPELTTEVPTTTATTDPLLCGHVNLAILMDTSESLTDNLDHSKSSILGILDLLKSDTVNVSVFTFNEDVRLESGDKIPDVISKVKPSFGRTDLATSLDFVHKYGFDMTQADDTSNILLVFTDGYSNLNKKNTAKMAENLKKDDIHIITVSVSQQVNIEVLQDISSSYTVYQSKHPEYMEAVVSEMILATCQLKAKACERVDLVFLADSSGSINDMSPSNFQFMKNFIIQFAGLQELGLYTTQIGMATFSTYGRYEFFLNEGQNASDISSLVAAVRYMGGMTNILEGIKVARNQILYGQGSRPNAHKVLVLITDGYAEENEEIENEINMLKQDGVYVVTVGLTSWPNNENLRHWSSNAEVLQTPDYMGLNHIIQEFVKASCSDNNACPGRDVIFVVDSSWSMTEDEEESWNQTLEFVKDIVKSTEVEPSHGSQVSVITYNTHGRVEFSLEEGKLQASVLDLIDGIEYKGGKTNTAEGLELARKQMGNGRRWADDIIVFLTNGPANVRIEDTDDQARKAHEEGAYIIGIGVTEDTDKEELRHISDVMYTIENFADLQHLRSDVVSSICSGLK